MVDMVGINTFIQTALNLKVLCIEIKRLGEMRAVNDAKFREEFRRVIRYHQHIIKWAQLPKLIATFSR